MTRLQPMYDMQLPSRRACRKPDMLVWHRNIRGRDDKESRLSGYGRHVRLAASVSQEIELHAMSVGMDALPWLMSDFNRGTRLVGTPDDLETCPRSNPFHYCTTHIDGCDRPDLRGGTRIVERSGIGLETRCACPA